MMTEDAFNGEVAVILEKMSIFNPRHLKHSMSECKFVPSPRALGLPCSPNNKTNAKWFQIVHAVL